MLPRTVPGRSTALPPREKTHATCADHQSFALVPTPDDKHLVVQLQLVVDTLEVVVTLPLHKCAGRASPLEVRKEVTEREGKVRAQRAGLAHKWAGSSARVTERGSVLCTA